MELSPVSLLLAAGFLVLLYALNRLAQHLGRNFPPGPVKWPLLGNGALLKKFSIQYKGLHNGIEELCKLYSTDVLMLSLGGDYVVVVQSERLIDEVCTREEFQGRPDTFFVRLRSMGTRKGITMTDGALWQEQRAFAVRHLHSLGFGKTKMEYLIHEEIQDLFSKLSTGGKSIVLRKYISACVLNVLWAMVTGSRFKDPETLNNLIQFMERRAAAFDMSGGVLNQYPWARYIAPERTGYNLIRQLNRDFKKMITVTLDEHKVTYDKNVTRDFIDAFLHEMYKNTPGSFFTEDQLVMVCLDFFIAGSQTTSSTLDFALLKMIMHPDVQQKVQGELDCVLTSNQLPSFADKPRLPYTDAVLSESQRFTLTVPVIGPRRVLRDTTLGGYDIPEGATILMNLVPLTRDATKWVQPNDFFPERFTDGETRNENEINAFTFGRGKRRCPGEALAQRFLLIFFASFLHRYKLEPVNGERPTLDVVPGITLSPKPYNLKLSLRQ